MQYPSIINTISVFIYFSAILIPMLLILFILSITYKKSKKTQINNYAFSTYLQSVGLISLFNWVYKIKEGPIIDLRNTESRIMINENGYNNLEIFTYIFLAFITIYFIYYTYKYISSLKLVKEISVKLEENFIFVLTILSFTLLLLFLPFSTNVFMNSGDEAYYLMDILFVYFIIIFINIFHNILELKKIRKTKMH